MYMELYQVEDTANTMNKIKNLVTSMNITFKKQTNILSPYIKIHYPDGLEKFNYAYIEELGRYYFIVNIEPYPNDIFYLQFEVDVIESYASDINRANKVKYDNKVITNIDVIKSNYKVQDPSYVISTIGSGEKGVEDKNV